jgi:TPP-dependent trihydroxycyclohexane-1,2-dione (THcHDO) dehydratase
MRSGNCARVSPGPCIDFPSEVYRANYFTSELTYFHDKARYRTTARPYPGPKDLQAAVDLLKQARRPIIVSSNGVFYSRAWDALKRLAEKGDIPVVESGAMKGQFSDAHPLSANAAPGALASADVVVLAGQYCLWPANSPSGPTQVHSHRSQLRTSVAIFRLMSGW